MKRRDFLKILGAAPVIAAAPALVKADELIPVSGITSMTKDEYVAKFPPIENPLWDELAKARDTLNNHPNPSEEPEEGTTKISANSFEWYNHGRWIKVDL